MVRPSETRRIETPDGDYNVHRGLLEFGYQPRPLPAPVATLFDPPVRGLWRIAAEYTRTQGPQVLLDEQPIVWGVGVGADEKGGPAILFLVEPGYGDRFLGRFPARIEFGGAQFPVKVREESINLALTTSLTTTRTPFSGALTGSKVSTREDGILTDDPLTINGGGGTLAGTFRSSNGNSQRGITNAHVALGAGIQNLVSSLPGSLLTLLESPRGKRIIAWHDPSYSFGSAAPSGNVYSGSGPGRPYVLFRVDTDYPILTPIPFVPGMSPALALLMPIFIYTDVCAGPVRPQSLFPGGSPPPAPPEMRRTIRGARLGPSVFALPGEQVYKIGNATGTVWGDVLAVSLVIRLPIPPVIPFLPPQILIMNLNIYSLEERPGDSGAATIRRSGHRPASVDGLGTIVTSWGTPAYMVRLFTDTRF